MMTTLVFADVSNKVSLKKKANEKKSATTPESQQRGWAGWERSVCQEDPSRALSQQASDPWAGKSPLPTATSCNTQPDSLSTLIAPITAGCIPIESIGSDSPGDLYEAAAGNFPSVLYWADREGGGLQSPARISRAGDCRSSIAVRRICIARSCVIRVIFTVWRRLSSERL